LFASLRAVSVPAGRRGPLLRSGAVA